MIYYHLFKDVSHIQSHYNLNKYKKMIKIMKIQPKNKSQYSFMIQEIEINS